MIGPRTRAAVATLVAAACATLAACAHAPPPPDAALVVRAEPGAQLLVDDVYAGLARGEPLPLRSGFHRLEVRAEGRLSAYREVTLRPGERLTLDVPLRKDLDGATAP